MYHAAAMLHFSAEFYRLCVQCTTQYCGANSAIPVTQKKTEPELY